MGAREIQPLIVPPGTRALEVLPALERALDGDGPALLPLAEEQHENSAGGYGRLAEAEDDPEDPTALVIATSGSTGDPKGVLLSASALRASATATHERLGGPGQWLLSMPAQHIAGIQVLIRALLAGTRPHAVETSGGFRPEAFAEAARHVLDMGGPHYTALVPTQLGRLLHDDQGLAALREFDSVLLGGAATGPASLRAARDAGVRVRTTYGMSETSGGCVYGGIPLTGARAHIDHTGVISLAGPMLARGYRDEPDTSAFAGGWFRTGDLGRWTDGRLDVIGRADDVIISGGVNIAPLVVERVLAEQEGVREVCVFGVEDPDWGQAVVAAVVAGPWRPSVATLSAAVRQGVGKAATPKRIVFVPELPLRGPGKPDRQALRASLAEY